jgi:hypothetical protein
MLTSPHFDPKLCTTAIIDTVFTRIFIEKFLCLVGLNTSDSSYALPHGQAPVRKKEVTGVA